jgi:hypothetical protein
LECGEHFGGFVQETGKAIYERLMSNTDAEQPQLETDENCTQTGCGKDIDRKERVHVERRRREKSLSQGFGLGHVAVTIAPLSLGSGQDL